ncbi:MAG: hypothetical protein V4696_10685, partial [Pseudomonadota bacterium]
MTIAVLRASPGASLAQPKIAIIRLGENTAEAARQAVLAAAQVALAAEFAEDSEIAAALTAEFAGTVATIAA